MNFVSDIVLGQLYKNVLKVEAKRWEFEKKNEITVTILPGDFSGLLH